MRTVQRDRRTIWYALFKEVEDITDSDGNLTGEQRVIYHDPVKARMNVSGDKGVAAIEEFGIDNPFTRVAVTDDLKTPFNTDTIFWFGREPTEPHNYRCTGVSRTVNGVKLALEELDVTHEEDIVPIVSG